MALRNADLVGALGDRDEHDVHHADAADDQTDRTDHCLSESQARRSIDSTDCSGNPENSTSKVVFFVGGHVAEATHRLNYFILRSFEAHVFRGTVNAMINSLASG